MSNTIFINPQFCGPPDAGNGGYVSGLMSSYVDFTLEVTLHKPPPLAAPLNLVSDEAGIRLMHNEALIATAKPGEIAFEARDAPNFEQASKASQSYIGFDAHPFPECFVCGPNRDPENALRLFAGKVDGQDIVAAPWVPAQSLADSNGLVKTEFIWAALDCPGCFSIMQEPRPMVLGRIVAKIEHQIKVEERCVVIGWHKGSDRRKHFSGTAVYSETNGLCAVAHATWIDLAK